MDLTSDNTVHLDSTQTVGFMVFGDANPATGGSWVIDDNGSGGANVLTFATLGNYPSITVNALGAGKTATISVAMAIGGTLYKYGPGTLVLSGPITHTGAFGNAFIISASSAGSGGTLRLDNGGSLTAMTLTIGGLSQTSTPGSNNAFVVNGGSFSTTTGAVVAQGGSGVLAGTAGSGALYSILEVDSGSATFNSGIATTLGLGGNGGGTIKFTGGTITTTALVLAKSGGGTVTNDATDHELDFSGKADGLIITGGNTTFSSYLMIGWGNATIGAAMLMTGGTVNVAGKAIVANGPAAANGGAGIRITGGIFTNTDTSANGGLVLLGSTANRTGTNFAMAEFAGGVSSVQKVSIAADSTLATGVANLYVDGGTLYVGSGGINRTSTATTLLYTIQLGGSGFAPGVNVSELGGTAVTGFGAGGTQYTGNGVLGASANWSSALNLTLAGNTTIQLADANAVPKNITLSGSLTGTGGFVETGSGMLTLSGNGNTYSGATVLNGGTLQINSSLPAASVVTINSGAALSGNGTVNGPITLNLGGAVAPGTNGTVGTLHGTDLTWNAGGQLRFDLAATPDRLALSGNLTKGSAGTCGFVFNGGGSLALGSTVTLATFAATNFTAADLSASGGPAGYFMVNASNLQFVVGSAIGSIAGTVTDRFSNTLPGATVSVVVGGTTYAATTADDGTYTISNVPAGTDYTVTAVATGFTTGLATGVTITANTTTPGVTITLNVGYATWAAGRFTQAQMADPSISGSNSDPAHDGVPNVLKYAFNMNPLAPDRSGLHIELFFFVPIIF